jgi:hypothetical protein
MDEAEDDRVQATLVELLAHVGPAAGPAILGRLPGMRWNQVRPMLALLGKHPEWECGYAPSHWSAHPDPAVRREVLRQELRHPETRDASIVRALADADEANVRLGLGAAMTGCPTDAAAVLRARADDTTLSADLRALGIRALASCRAPETSAWLVQRVVKTGRLLKRETLASKTPELLAALEGLSTHWRDEASVQPALALAAASGDPEIVAAGAMTRRASVQMVMVTPTVGMPTVDGEGQP